MADVPDSTKLPERANYTAIAPGSYLGAIVKGAPFILDFDHDGEELVRVADVQPADDVCCKVRLEGETFWHPEFEFRRRATPLYTRTAPPAMDREAVEQIEKLKPGYPDYVDDPDGLDRFREQVKRESGHDMAVCNNNSLGRLIDTIERLRFERDQALSTLSADAIRQGEGATTEQFAVVGSDLWRHVKRGTVYKVLGTAELQAGQPQLEHAALVIYRGEDGKLWARNSGEFHDGRFVPATPASHASDGGMA